LVGAPVDLKTWTDVARNRMIVFAALDHDIADVRPIRRVHIHGTAVDQADACRPECSWAGVRALRPVRLYRNCDRNPRRGFLGSYKTSLLFTVLMLTGLAGWALSAGIYPLMAGSVALWGLGFASTNSMQQVRLVAAAPTLASASVSLNTSVLYIGQAVGSAIGGVLYARDLLYAAGYVSMGFVALALIAMIYSGRLSGARS
jgi:MFS transporter, DHA1 family, inner membrane transport protein